MQGGYKQIEPRWKPGESGNPAGRPVGSKSLSTVIRELLEDPNYEIKFRDGSIRKYPAKVIADVMARKAASGDVQAATYLARYGYGDKVDITSGGEPINFSAGTPRPGEITEGEIVNDTMPKLPDPDQDLPK